MIKIVGRPLYLLRHTIARNPAIPIPSSAIHDGSGVYVVFFATVDEVCIAVAVTVVTGVILVT
jgi:hypothetical protein